MTLAAFALATIFVSCMAFFTAAVGRLTGELLIGALSRPKPLPRAAAFALRLLSWMAGGAAGGVASWNYFWNGLSSEGGGISFPHVPRGEVWLAAVVAGLVLLWWASWMARSRASKAAQG